MSLNYVLLKMRFKTCGRYNCVDMEQYYTESIDLVHESVPLSGDNVHILC